MSSENNAIQIKWPCRMVVPTKKCESRVIQILHRKGEWGRGRDLPQRRIDEISAACSKNHMLLYQALSLRRSMLRSFPNGMAKVNRSSQMGSNEGQLEIASLFEDAVSSYIQSKLPMNTKTRYFLTEADLLSEMKTRIRPRGPTPDILFLHPVYINGRLVKWVDAKLYYGSKTYAHNKKIPNGKLVGIAKRYNDYYGGQGAFVFGQGFCAELRSVVTGALLLDASPLDMTAVDEFQNNSFAK